MEKFDFAIQVLVIGFAVVMFTLFVLYGLLLLFARIFHKEDQKPAAAVRAGATAESQVGGKDDDKRRVAAIMAAVYQYMHLHQMLPQSGRISISVTPQEAMAGNGWQITGRRMLLQNRMELENIRRKNARENI